MSDLKIVYIQQTRGRCTGCGKDEVLRPYGVDGALVCEPCAKKNEPVALAALHALIDGADAIVWLDEAGAMIGFKCDSSVFERVLPLLKPSVFGPLP